MKKGTKAAIAASAAAAVNEDALGVFAFAEMAHERQPLAAVQRIT